MDHNITTESRNIFLKTLIQLYFQLKNACMYAILKELNVNIKGIKSKLDEKRVLAWITQTSCGLSMLFNCVKQCSKYFMKI